MFTFGRIGAIVLVVWLLVTAFCLYAYMNVTVDIEPAELEKFVDSVVADRIGPGGIPGAAVVIVRGNQVLLLKGYGYADLNSKGPVLPDAPLFRVGSVSKVLTAVSVLQLVDEGKIKLDRDVNEYLKNFQLESKFLRPVRSFATPTTGILFSDTWWRRLQDHLYLIILKKHCFARSG